MARSRVHRFVLVDRGEVHVHRFTATCSCGWPGANRRTRKTAKKLWRQHERGTRSSTYRRGPRRRPCTPEDQLPAELRTVA